MSNGPLSGNTIRVQDLHPFFQTIGMGHLIENGGGNMLNQLWTDDGTIVYTNGGTTIYVYRPGSGTWEQRATTSDYAAADAITGAVVIGGFLYVMLLDTGTSPNTRRIYRYQIGSLSSTGTLCTFSGATVLANATVNMMFTTDGNGSFYFNFRAGNTANDYDLAKFTVAAGGSVFTFASNFSCGSTANKVQRFAVASATRTVGSVTVTAGDIIAWSTTSNVMLRYNAAGTLQTTGTQVVATGNTGGILYLNDWGLYLGYLGDAATGAEVAFYARIVIV